MQGSQNKKEYYVAMKKMKFSVKTMDSRPNKGLFQKTRRKTRI